MRRLKLLGHDLPEWVVAIDPKESACRYCGARIHWARTKRKDGTKGRAPMVLATTECDCLPMMRGVGEPCKECNDTGEWTHWQPHHLDCPYAKRATEDARRRREA